MSSRSFKALCCGLAAIFGTDLSAQPARPVPQPPSMAATLFADVLRDLPAGGNIFSILETTQPEIVADRFNSGGLNVGGSSRLGGFLASWSQTQWRLGDVSISSPSDGSPLLFPEMTFWDRVRVTTGLMPADTNAPGLAVSLSPLRPSGKWGGTIEGAGSGGRLVSVPGSDRAPAIARLDQWRRGSAIVAGPLHGRSSSAHPQIGLLIGGTWMENSTFARADPRRRHGQVSSAFTHAIFTPAAGSEVRAIGWVQRANLATEDLSTHIQTTFARHAPSTVPWRVFASFTQRDRSGEVASVNTPIVDRLSQGPVPDALADVDETERRWTLGLRMSPPSGERQVWDLGADVDGSSARARQPSESLIRELVDGVPARIWAYRTPGHESKRRATTLALFASDRMALSPRLTLNAAVRLESASGTANGASAGIRWWTLLPSASLQWVLGSPYAMTFVTGYRRSSNQLLLGLLAWGDPAAPAGSVFRWDPEPAAAGTLIARVGPGTGGDASFSRIDPDLKQPHTDEFAIGLESRPGPALRFAVMGVARRQSALVNVVNIGVPVTSYLRFTIPDDNVDLIGTTDDQLLPVYNRLPESFGRDRYVLTNPHHDSATLGALIVTAQASSDRLFLLIGASASAVVGSGGNRGFRAGENDPDALGELFTNPNASTFARGRLFSDRAYVIKWTTVYRFAKDIRLGAIARYQDGQPFARVVVVPELNQGAEPIQAFANGRSRLAFTGTLDVRLQKSFAVGPTRLDAIVDAYNLLNMSKEVEEYVVTGARFRAITATQPPRAFHLGVRLTF